MLEIVPSNQLLVNIEVFGNATLSRIGFLFIE